LITSGIITPRTFVIIPNVKYARKITQSKPEGRSGIREPRKGTSHAEGDTKFLTALNSYFASTLPDSPGIILIQLGTYVLFSAGMRNEFLGTPADTAATTGPALIFRSERKAAALING
jgi:hypothetical protein